MPKERYTIAPLKASYNAIDYIVANYPKPYTLMLSGGVDSQAMLWAWHTYGVEFNTFSAVYNHGFNEHDLSTLRQFINIHNIPVNFVNFDVLDFLQNEHLNYVEKFRCGSPHMTTFMKLSENIKNGTVIMSGNFVKEDKKFLPFGRNQIGLCRYSQMTQKPIVPFFFCATQELAYSFNLKTKIDRSLYINDATEQVKNDLGYKIKCQTYLDNEFPIIEQDKKYTGFEKLKDYYDENFSHLITPKHKLFKGPFQRSLRTFDLLLRNKYEIGFNTDKYFFIPETDHA